MYYDYNEEINKIKPHRVLAVNRAEKEKVVLLSTTIIDWNELKSLSIIVIYTY